MATAKNDYFYALGRRKSSTARVRLTSGKGILIVNDKLAEDYFAGSHYLLKDLIKPFAALDQPNNYNISAKVDGGGHKGQAGAIQLAIAKALVLLNPDLKATLKKADLLGRDSRTKERKKFGLRGARKQRQFTKR